MTETMPMSTCSVSKTDVVAKTHEDTSLEHAIKIEEVIVKPDYIVYETDTHMEMMNMENKTKDLLVDGPNDSLAANTNVHVKEALISQHNNDGSEIHENEEKELNKHTDVRSEIDNNCGIIPLNEHGIPNEFNTKLKMQQAEESNRKIYVEDCKYHMDASNSNKNINQNSRIYSCNDCTYKSVNRGTFVIHLRRHTGEKPYSCTYCGYECAFKSNLTQHLRTHTGDKPFSCTCCEYRCSQKAHLTLHLRIHAGEKPFSCKLCNFSSVNKSNLIRHLRQHTGEKPFACSFCEYKCSCKSHLTAHIRSHTGEKPFTCEFCEYRCAQRAHLITHLRTHTGEKPYSCKFCKYQSTKKSNLTQHLRKHTGEKPYPCEYCEYRSRTSTALKRHLKTHTGGIPSNVKSVVENLDNRLI